MRTIAINCFTICAILTVYSQILPRWFIYIDIAVLVLCAIVMAASEIVWYRKEDNESR